jgi:cell division protein FtsL
MGLAVKRVEAPVHGRGSSHLSLVTPVSCGRKKPDAEAKAREDARAARARVAFWAFMCVLCVSVTLGGVRVAVIAQATRISLSESRLQAAIQAQRFESAQLEVDHSALSSPSRIAGIAASKMKMDAPAPVRYIRLPKVPGAGSSPSRSARSSANGAGDESVLSSLVRISAGQAQSLLVGDLGLAGSR